MPFCLHQKCADDEVSDKKNYPTFARTRPPAAQVTTSILSLLLHFNWTRFSLVVGSSHGQQRVARKLLQLAKDHNLTVNHVKEFREPYMSLVAGNPFPEIIQETYVETRGELLLLLLCSYTSPWLPELFYPKSPRRLT